MISTIAVAFAFASTATPINLQTPKTLIQQVVGAPTGMNGYEEYLRAADVVNDSAFDTYVNAGYGTDPTFDRNTSPALVKLGKSLSEMNLLQVRRAAVEHYGKSLDLIRQGNQKPVFDPRVDLQPNTTFPEFSAFKRISRLISMKAYVQFADGNTLGGTQTLLDGLEFSYKLSGSTIISTLVGIASSSIAFASFQDLLPSVSLQDAQKMQQISDAILKAPLPIASSFVGERRLMLASLSMIERDPDVAIKDIGANDDPEMVRLAETLRAASPAQRGQWMREAVAEFDAQSARMIQLLDQPEYVWAEAKDELENPAAPASPAGQLLQYLVPFYGQSLMAVARQRTQFRLLGLHGAILQFRWQHGRLPTNLSEVVNAKHIYDPFANESFRYELTSGGYRVYSKGNGGFGEIELRYKAPTSSAAKPQADLSVVRREG